MPNNALSSHIATVNERLNNLENQVNNDITGRKVVGEMRQDIAVIKTQITDTAVRNSKS